MSARSPQSALRAFVRRSHSNGGRRLAIPTWWRYAGPLTTVCRASGANRAGFKQTTSAEGDCSVRVDVRLRRGCGVVRSIFAAAKRSTLSKQTRMNLTEARTVSMRLARLAATRRLAACFCGVFVGPSDLVCAVRLIA
jgi:hypothetical protein